MPVFISDIRCRRAVRPSPANLLSLVELTVFFVRNGFEPLVGSVLAGNLECKMGEPAIGRRPVPVLDIGRDRDDRTGLEADSGPPLLLLPALAGRADQELASAGRGVMDVPVVAAARLKGDVCKKDGLLRIGQRIEDGHAEKNTARRRCFPRPCQRRFPVQMRLHSEFS